ncbi:MAG: hypothetical protein NDF55_01550 [archaeon GB-1867-005]|nr:hypothetical protein [Candidatus Culexmicrobium cathedralense]
MKNRKTLTITILILMLTTLIIKPIHAVRQPTIIKIERSKTWNAKINALNELYETYIEEEIKIKNNSSRKVTLNIHALAENIMPSSITFQDKTPTPEIQKITNEIILLTWRKVEIQPESTLKLKYQATPTQEFPLKIERYIYVNNKLEKIVKSGGRYKVKAEIGDAISICLKLKNKASEIFINEKLIKPPIYLQVSISYDDSIYDLISPEIKSQYGSPSITLTLTETQWLNITLKVRSLGSWGEVELPDITIYGSITASTYQAASLKESIERLSGLISYLKYMELILTALKIYVEAFPAFYSTQPAPTNAYTIIDIMEASIIETLNQYEETVNEYQQTIENITKQHPSLREPLSDINETLNEIEESIRETKEQISSSFTQLRSALQAMPEAQPSASQLQPTTQAIDNLLIQLTKFRAEAENQMNNLLNLLGLMDYLNSESNYPRIWATLGYTSKDYTSTHVKKVNEDLWALEEVELLPGIATSSGDKIYLLYMIIQVNNSEITSIEYKATEGWKPIRDLKSLKIEKQNANTIVIPIFKEVDLKSRTIINALEHPIVGKIRILLTSATKPNLNIKIIKAIKPAYVAYAANDKYKVIMKNLLISSLPTYKEIKPPQKEIKAINQYYYYAAAATALLLAASYIIWRRKRKKIEKEDEEIEYMERKLEELMSKLKT